MQTTRKPSRRGTLNVLRICEISRPLPTPSARLMSNSRVRNSVVACFNSSKGLRPTRPLTVTLLLALDSVVPELK